MALEKFCFCCKLHNGVLIWGGLCILRSFIVLIATVAVACGEHTDYDYGSSSTYYTHETEMGPLYWFIGIATIVDLMSAVALVVGSVQRNHYLMLPWIILNGIGLLPLVIVGALIIIISLPILGPIYIWWCVCSAYQKMQENSPNSYCEFYAPSQSFLKMSTVPKVA